MSARSGYSGGKTLNNTVPRRLFALGLFGILFISVCALLPSPAQAQCKRWDVSGQWDLEMSNGVNIQVNLQQGEWAGTSANLSGTGTYAVSAGGAPHGGVISGNITDNAFAMKLATDTTAFRYTGKVGRGGKIEGTTDNGVHWVGTRRMKCADPATPAGTPRPRGSGPREQ
jgi:hypothetical protein